MRFIIITSFEKNKTKKHCDAATCGLLNKDSKTVKEQSFISMIYKVYTIKHQRLHENVWFLSLFFSFIKLPNAPVPVIKLTLLTKPTLWKRCC